MITGFNTNVEHCGRVFHVQTQDLGRSNPVLHSVVYLGGEIVTVLRTSYADLTESSDFSTEQLAQLLEAQHRRLIGDIRGGCFDAAPGQDDDLAVDVADPGEPVEGHQRQERPRPVQAHGGENHSREAAAADADRRRFARLLLEQSRRPLRSRALLAAGILGLTVLVGDLVWLHWRLAQEPTVAVVSRLEEPRPMTGAGAMDRLKRDMASQPARPDERSEENELTRPTAAPDHDAASPPAPEAPPVRHDSMRHPAAGLPHRVAAGEGEAAPATATATATATTNSAPVVPVSKSGPRPGTPLPEADHSDSPEEPAPAQEQIRPVSPVPEEPREASVSPRPADPPAPEAWTGMLADYASLDVRPRPTRRELPRFTKRAKRKKQAGVVELNLLIDERGRVADVELIRGIPESDLNRTAMEAARLWAYAPGRKGSYAVKTWMPVKVGFSFLPGRTTRVYIEE
jgi:TonB family protein